MALNFLAHLSANGKIWVIRAVKGLIVFLIIFSAYRLFNFAATSPNTFKVGMDSTWYPLDLYGKEYTMTAFTTDLLNAIARDQNLKLEVVRTSHTRLLELLEDDIVDGILTPLVPEKDLENQFYFSDPYYRFGAVIVVRKDSDIRSLQELGKGRLGINRHSPILYRLPGDFHAAVVPYDNFLMTLSALADKKVDAVVVDQLLYFLYFGSLYRDQMKVATLPLTNEGLRLMTLKERQAKFFIEKFNEGLKRLKENNSYDRLLQKWDIYDPEKLNP